MSDTEIQETTIKCENCEHQQKHRIKGFFIDMIDGSKVFVSTEHRGIVICERCGCEI